MQQPSSSGNQEQHLRAQLELLQSHDANASTASGSCNSRNATSDSPPARTANGYEELAAASHEAARALRKTQAESHIHPDLRASPGHPSSMMPMGPPSAHSPGASSSGPVNASIAPAPSSSVPEPGAVGDGRKAKRELSQSKRAAQNRAAQRAFRQRKEGYIKKLEQQVRDYAEMEQTYKAVQAENYALREYVIHLQSRLIDTQGDYPPPPPNINLSQSSAAQPPPASAPEQVANAGVGTPLEAVAQAVAGLAAQEQLAECQGRYPSPVYKPESRDEDSRTVEEINRQLQQQSEESVSRSTDV
ncbi:uncharacterized protein MAM_03966 [Metarhizium album ARSEF 1941]|uniref:Putative transcription factor kapC n=1 Tax=Metarhizium album (strain ARSEF 1941) TaxID=1081103 RepID=A0A0B2WZC3_METAS|nr:uncharacterized protein MAM_03966 [Metarhizium album ARSEF 1941]KHN98205.1 transmembrane protein [Metarhizium album ARSEF 1941]